MHSRDTICDYRELPLQFGVVVIHVGTWHHTKFTFVATIAIAIIPFT